jgi:phasin
MTTTSSTRKFPESSTVPGKHTFEEASAAGKEAARRVEDTYSKAFQEAMDYNRKALAIAQANVDAVFECAQKLMGVRSPSEFMEVATNHARQQVQAMTEQTKELTALAQKAAVHSVEPLTSGLTSAFRGTT